MYTYKFLGKLQIFFFNCWQIFKNLFEEGLEIQKQRLRDLRAYAQEKRDEQRREHQNELESLENYYKDQVKFHLHQADHIFPLRSLCLLSSTHTHVMFSFPC